MIFVVSGIVKLVIEVSGTSTRTTYELIEFPRYFPFSYVVYVKLLQPQNAEEPMLVTLSGIVILVKLLQPENAEEPMLVTLSGIVMLAKLLQ